MIGGTRFFFPRRQHQHQGGRPKLRHREVLVDARHRLRDGIAIAGVGTLGTLGTRTKRADAVARELHDDRSNRVFKPGIRASKPHRFETRPAASAAASPAEDERVWDTSHTTAPRATAVSHAGSATLAAGGSSPLRRVPGAFLEKRRASGAA